MLGDAARLVAESARQLYEERYRSLLEASDPGAFVCIEPASGDYFLGKTLDEAVNQALDAHPDRLTHTLRVGHDAALHLGAFGS